MPSKRKSTPEPTPALNNRKPPSKRKNTPEPSSPAPPAKNYDDDDFELDFPPLSELRKRAEENAKKNNIEEIFESENESENEDESPSELSSKSSSNNDNDEHQE
jgi:hypothetical protein